MEKIEEDVKNFYENYDEDSRLIKDPAHQIEFLITMEFLERYLPKKGKILDAGGATGRYSIELAKKGYNVVLLDLSPKHIQIANNKISSQKLNNKIKTQVGTILDLNEYQDGEFDAVLCLGATLSHVAIPEKVKKAMKELVRVAKRNAPIFVSVTGLAGAAKVTIKYLQKELPAYEKIMQTGYNAKGQTGGFTHARFFTGKELEKLFEDCSLKIIDKVGLEGISSAMNPEVNKIYENKKLWNSLLRILKHTANDQTAYGASIHFMLIGKKN